jgi:hypothetical protein
VFIQLHHVPKAEREGVVRASVPEGNTRQWNTKIPQLFSRQLALPVAISPYLVGRAGVAPATQLAAVLQTVAHTGRRADLY